MSQRRILGSGTQSLVPILGSFTSTSPSPTSLPPPPLSLPHLSLFPRDVASITRCSLCLEPTIY